MKILHLSDLHFMDSDVTQDIVIESLCSAIESLCKKKQKPDILIITGDIAYSGKADEYAKAIEFIQKVKSYCEISKENVFTTPGNHDVDRTAVEVRHIRWWYNFTDEQTLIDVLTSDDSFPIIFKKTDAYFKFAKQVMSDQIKFGNYGEFIFQVPRANTDTYNLKIIGLNSALFCGYDGDDKGKLALGITQTRTIKNCINTNEEVIISCIHHPFNCFHPCDTPALNVLKKQSDLILYGHVHESCNDGRRDGSTGETTYISAGSCFEKRTTQNGFSFIEIDLNTLKGSATFYKYLQGEQEWIINKDINRENDGIFHFNISNKTSKQTSIQSKQTGKSTVFYSIELMGVFDELNRTKVKSILNKFQVLIPEVQITLRKIEKGSINFIVETNREIPQRIKEELHQIENYTVICITKIVNTISQSDVNTIDKSILHWEICLKPVVLDSIENPGAAFTHSRVDTIYLSDLFVAPYLQEILQDKQTKSNVQTVLRADKVLTKQPNKKINIVVYGSESAGKTTLLKWWYKKYYENGYIPISIAGDLLNTIKTDRIYKIIETEFRKQYLNVEGINLCDFDKDRIIIMIDDFHRVKFSKPKYKANLLSNLYNEYFNVIIFGNDLMHYENYTSKTGNIHNLFDDYDAFQLLEFGATLRYELIKNWIALGNEQLDPNDQIRMTKETEAHVETIIGKNFIPSYPIYIMTILQAREASTSQKPEYSMHGFYYELLINESLNKAVKNKADISLYYNYITEYSYFLFNSKIGRNPISLESFDVFHYKYCTDYNIEIHPNIVLNTLINAKLIKLTKESVSLSFKYVYYFFVARYLANKLSNELIKNLVRSLCQRVYRDEFASIVMFLTHLSKDQFIFDELLQNSKTLFTEIKPIQLNEDVLFINELISQLPPQIFEPIDIEQAKEDELKEKEELEKQEKEFDETTDVSNYDISEDITMLDGLSKIIKAVKTIELVGQLTKKYWGELKGPQKYELAEETYLLGLRTLGFYCSSIKHGTAQLIQYLKLLYRRKHLNQVISKDEIEQMSREYLFGLCVMASYGIIKIVTNAIGYDKLSSTFGKILENHPYNSVRLIDFSIKLDHNKLFPWVELEELLEVIKKHFLTDMILRNLVINYLYLFHTTVEEKQKICNLLGIKMDQQRLIDIGSKIKK